MIYLINSAHVRDFMVFMAVIGQIVFWWLYRIVFGLWHRVVFGLWHHVVL